MSFWIGLAGFFGLIAPIPMAIAELSAWWLFALAVPLALLGTVQKVLLQRQWLQRPGHLILATMLNIVSFIVPLLAIYWVTALLVWLLQG